MANPKLTRYRLKNVEGISAIRVTSGLYQLEDITDKEADLISAMGQAKQYLEKIEPPAPTGKKRKSAPKK